MSSECSIRWFIVTSSYTGKFTKIFPEFMDYGRHRGSLVTHNHHGYTVKVTTRSVCPSYCCGWRIQRSYLAYLSAESVTKPDLQPHRSRARVHTHIHKNKQLLFSRHRTRIIAGWFLFSDGGRWVVPWLGGVTGRRSNAWKEKKRFPESYKLPKAFV